MRTYNPAMVTLTFLPSVRAGLITLCVSAALPVWAVGPTAPAPPDLGRLQATAVPASAPAASASAVAQRKGGAARPAAASASAGAASSPQAVVIEDRYTRIEELHERGEVRSVKVQPKVGRPYEIVPATGGRDMSNSAGNGRAAAGQRVWPVLSF